MEVREEQSENVELPMLVTLLGIVMDVSAEQLQNVLYSIVFLLLEC